MDYIMGELFYKRTILQRNYRKMTIKWSFSYNSFVKRSFMTILYPKNHCHNKVCYKGTPQLKLGDKNQH